MGGEEQSAFSSQHSARKHPRLRITVSWAW